MHALPQRRSARVMERNGSRRHEQTNAGTQRASGDWLCPTYVAESMKRKHWSVSRCWCEPAACHCIEQSSISSGPACRAISVRWPSISATPSERWRNARTCQRDAHTNGPKRRLWERVSLTKRRLVEHLSLPKRRLVEHLSLPKRIYLERLLVAKRRLFERLCWFQADA